MDNIFNGFAPPTKNYFHMPNEWVNISAKINNLAELKVIEYVLRHTWGYHEYDGRPKPITTDEFMHGRKRADGARMDDGTGLSNKSVVEGLKRAIDHGYLICVVDDTDKARISKSYALKMNHPDSNRYVESTHQPDMKNLHSGVKNLHSDYVRSSQRSEKDTLEKHSRKKESKPPVTADKPETLTPSSTPSSLSEPSFSPEEETVYQLASQLKLSYLKRNEKHKTYCSKLVKEKVMTLEKMQSLMEFCGQRDYLKGKDLNLGNLARELDGWLQLQKQTVKEPTKCKKTKVTNEYLKANTVYW